MADRSESQEKILKILMDLNKRIALMAILQKLNVSDALVKLLEEK